VVDREPFADTRHTLGCLRSAWKDALSFLARSVYI